MKKNKILCAILSMTILACAAGCNGVSTNTAAEKKDSAVATSGSDKTKNGAESGSDKTADEGAAKDIAAEDRIAASDRVEIKGDVKSDRKYSLDAEMNAKEDIAMPDTAPAEAAEETFTAEIPEMPVTEPSTTTQEIPEAGQLTAGEWNDNENWGFFKNLVNSGKIEFPSYGLDPRNRIKVDVKNDSNAPVVNAKVRLLDAKDNSVLWSSVTDKTGTAYLFTDGTAGSVIVEAESGGIKNNSEGIIFDSEGSNSQGSSKKEDDYEVSLKLADNGVSYKKTDIMFIMDATGSMMDEMLFLQSEFSAITKDIGTQDVRYSVNFYRDEGDDYVTKCNNFTNDISTLQKLLNAERADGGGDLPEAVDKILDETINKSNWSDDSVKLAFLIFDAPPHDGTDAKILDTIKKASEKGIHIIPVVSSNSDRNTELFGRALSITTGSTYVFLTDDSGIGDSHLEPIIGSYDVEKLYDIIIRIIKDYQQ